MKKTRMKIIDLTDYDMESWEGVQFFSQGDARDFVLRKKLKKRAYIDKEVKPNWWGGDDWKQTYTVRKTDALPQSSNVRKAIKELLRK